MAKETINHKDGARLWARARGAWAAPPGAEPDAVALAAYLDGTLDPEARARIEAWMAGSLDALNLVVAAREAGAEAPAAAPADVVRRAQGLVRARRPATGGFAARLGALLAPDAPFWRPVAWAGVSAALLLVSVSGFELGRAGTLHMVSLQVEMRQAEQAPAVLARTSQPTAGLATAEMATAEMATAELAKADLDLAELARADLDDDDFGFGLDDPADDLL